MADDPDFEPSFLPRIREKKKKKKTLEGLSKGAVELDTLEDAVALNPFSDPEHQQTPLAGVTLEGRTSQERSVMRGRKSTMGQEEKQMTFAAEKPNQGKAEEEKVVYMVSQKPRNKQEGFTSVRNAQIRHASAGNGSIDQEVSLEIGDYSSQKRSRLKEVIPQISLKQELKNKKYTKLNLPYRDKVK